jgi:hypothetical protein
MAESAMAESATAESATAVSDLAVSGRLASLVVRSATRMSAVAESARCASATAASGSVAGGVPQSPQAAINPFSAKTIDNRQDSMLFFLLCNGISSTAISARFSEYRQPESSVRDKAASGSPARARTMAQQGV